MTADAANATMRKFGHPDTVVADYERWTVLARPQQATLGALVLVCREPATAFSQLSPQAFAELGRVIRDVEGALAHAFAYDKINYLMLMMVDPDVHFHVIPRYGQARSFAGVEFLDRGWPRQPELAGVAEAEAVTLRQIRDAVKQHWAPAAA